MCFESGLTKSLPEKLSIIQTAYKILHALTYWVTLLTAAKDQLCISSAHSSIYL